jgi:hypothetical protein
MNMRFAIRPYVIAGVAMTGAASVVALLPTGPQLPDVQVPTVQPAGTAHSDLDLHDLIGLLGEPDGLLPAPEVVPDPGTESLSPAGELPEPAKLPDPAIVPPDLSGGGFSAAPGSVTLTVPGADAPAGQ